MRGPPITIRCDCGAQRPVPYGERWTCPVCGKTWNTAQIPAEEYREVIRAARRYRLVVWAITAAIVAVLVPLAVLVAFQFFIFVILALGVLYFFVLPKWRGRVLNKMSGRPSWTLHPE